MELKQALEDELKLYKFIPLETLDRLITQESVASYLDENPLDRDATYLQQITSIAPKLFAILVLLGRENSIKDYLSKGFCDKNFPILDKSDIPDIGRTEDKQELYKKQWQIPIVLQQSQHLDLPLEFIPPFLEQRYVHHGSFGAVYKVRVANGQLPQCNSVRAVIPRCRQTDL